MPMRRKAKQDSKSPSVTRRRAVDAKPRSVVDDEPVHFRMLTIGHSTRPIADFIRMLKAHGVTRLIDVRTVPRSRHNPQFSREQLPGSLEEGGITYLHRAALGGLRRTSPASPNGAWRNASFRGYADHMQTKEFNAAVDELIQFAQHDCVAVMCAEALPWRCHRSLIADALLVRGVPTADITSPSRLSPHRLTPFAKVHGTTVTYPADAASMSPRATAGSPRRRSQPPSNP